MLYADQTEAEYVKMIFETYLETSSIRETTRRLNSAGYKTRKGGRWTGTSIARMLSNPTYLGKMPYGRRRTDTLTGELAKVDDIEMIVVDGTHPPLLEPETYETVQHVLESGSFKKSRSARTYLLSRVLHCGKCGSPMYGSIHTKPDGREYTYYRCQGRKGDEPGRCEGLTIPAKQLDPFVVQTLVELSKDQHFLGDRQKMLEAIEREAEPGHSKAEDELERLKTVERDLKSRMDVLLDALETKTIERETFMDRYSRLNELLTDNRARQEVLQDLAASQDTRRASLEASFEAIESFGENWDYLDDEGKAAKIQTIVKRITVTEDDLNLEIFLDVPPFTEVGEVSRTGTGSWPR